VRARPPAQEAFDAVRLTLAGDAMLGRDVAEALSSRPPSALFAAEVVQEARAADLCLLNLECCISERGDPWPKRGFHFRAPPAAAEALAHLGVDCVTLANNHALDFGHDALLDTLEHLRRGGIACIGAGAGLEQARAPAVLQAGGVRLGVLGVTDHPQEYAATSDRPGVAFANLSSGGAPDWLLESIRALDSELVLVTPHWGPNMVREPVRSVRAAAAALVEAGSTLVAGHSAHVFHGVADRVIYDLGDFVDDYRVDPLLRNDLGLLWLVDVEAGRPTRLEMLPLKLEHCHTRLATGEDAAWVRHRFHLACAALGTEVAEEGGRLVIRLG
jgi:poly-gamma-glutamate capsule biosynthesis protein CapA/YwtB (metallophosphatase superfamily)